jgi:hypothetical protein
MAMPPPAPVRLTTFTWTPVFFHPLGQTAVDLVVLPPAENAQ